MKWTAFRTWTLAHCSGKYLSNEVRGVLLGVGSLGDDSVEELAARDQFHDQIDVLLLVICVVQLDDVRMPKPAEKLLVDRIFPEGRFQARLLPVFQDPDIRQSSQYNPVA